MRRWPWIVIAICFALICTMTWSRIRGLSAADDQRAPQIGVHFLTHDADAVDYWPIFSPDGKTILFSRQRLGDKTWHFYVVPTQGGEARPFMSGNTHVSATRANWSARTNVIAFTNALSGRENQTWLVRGDGTQARALTIQGLSDDTDYPSWYPDGNTFALMDARKGVLQRVDVQAGTSTAMTRHDQVMAGMPSVSPDGRCIVFAGQKNTGQPYDQRRNSIWLVCDGGKAHPLEAKPQQGRAPTWSPDGKSIAFESNRGSSIKALYAIFVIDRDGSEPKQITPYWINANHPVWSPDGKQLVFTARQKKGFWRYGSGIAVTDVRLP
jgi:Tol biopolymer transport system component